VTIGGVGTIFGPEPHDEDSHDLELAYAGIRAANARYLTIHGVDVDIANRLEGLGAAGLSVRAGEISGATLAAALVKAHTLTGFSAGAVNYFDEYQVGLSIGIVNIAQRLNGIQLGIINIARNNSSPFRVLPIINAHFE